MQSLRDKQVYFIVIIGCILLSYYALDLFVNDLNTPIVYYGCDDFYHKSLAKNMIDNGNIWKNEYLGYPFQAEFYNFPMVSFTYLYICKLLSFYIKDFFLIINVYYILTFVLTSITTLYVMRKMKFADHWAAFAALVYPFCQYHYLHSILHMSAISFYGVPLIVYLCYIIFTRDFRQWSIKHIKTLDAVKYVSVIFLFACTDIFYAFFGCFFLLIVIIYKLCHKNIHNAIAGIVIIISVVCMMVINYLPAVMMMSSNMNRHSPSSANTYSLPLIGLVSPYNQNHPFYFITSRVVNAGVSKDETFASYLGLIGVIGFVTMILWLFNEKLFSDKREIMAKLLSILNISSILLAVPFSLNFLFALFISSSIRTYCRIVIFIILFSLIALTIILENVCRKIKRIYQILLVVVLISINLFDSSPRALAYNHEGEQYASDRQFVQSIEEMLEEGAAVYQLPYISFPENYANDNRLLKGYLHSDKLKWSGGLVQNTEYVPYLEAISMITDYDNYLSILKYYGYQGVYCDTAILSNDRDGFSIARSFYNYLAENFSEQMIISEKGDLYFFDIRDVDKKTNTTETIQMAFFNGFYKENEIEDERFQTWRWMSNSGNISIVNTFFEDVDVKLSFKAVTTDEEYSTLVLSGTVNKEYQLNNQIAEYDVQFTLQPGVNIIEVSSDTRPIDAPNDSRTLLLQFGDYSIEIK